MEFKAIIGSNYGDEGKGISAYLLTKCCPFKRTLTVMTNGGCQRGHTVHTDVIDPETNEKKEFRHVFQCFGSATKVYEKDNTSYLSKDTSYYSSKFILNPIPFRTEFEELVKLKLFSEDYSCYCHPRVRWSTPFDMIVNQVLEDSKGDNRNGSCGYGIWETVLRYRNSNAYDMPILDFHMRNEMDKMSWLNEIKSYFNKRLADVGIDVTKTKYKDTWNDPKLLYHFIEDFDFMASKLIFDDSLKNVVDRVKPDIVLFENAQGLLLDSNPDDPTTTPSVTGCKDILKLMEDNFTGGVLDVHYITRPYVTRHGNVAPMMELKDFKSDDKTNTPNQWQGSIRYYHLDPKDFKMRTYYNFMYGVLDLRLPLKNRYEIFYTVTHMDEDNGTVKDIQKDTMIHDATEYKSKYYDVLNFKARH